MNSAPFLWIEPHLHHAGIYHWGVSAAAPLPHTETHIMEQWLYRGMHASMAYMERYTAMRHDPSLLLHGVKSIISVAVPYPAHPHPTSARVAAYALGSDYHEVLRNMLSIASQSIHTGYDKARWRVCVDTAPVRERYWAWRSGLAWLGRSGLALSPHLGTRFFLGEILTTLTLTPTDRLDDAKHPCTRCTRCTDSCPGHAITSGPHGLVDARRCHSYLTIEHRGPLPKGVNIGKHLYGCDVCTNVCPMSAITPPRHHIPSQFIPRDRVSTLTPAEVLAMSQEDFSATFTHSAVKRTKLFGLQRNARAIINGQG